MSTEPKKKSSIDWMYDGPSSSINREDYLTGKKVDKHFERSNPDFQEPQSKLDFVIQNKTLSSSTTPGGSSLLHLDTIKKEDPLVAIKVREEKVRREILENPVKMKRLQKIVMKSMEKKMRKYLEKERRKSRRSDDSESSSEEDEGRNRKSKSSERKDRSPIHRSRSSRDHDRHRSGNHSRRSRSPDYRSGTRGTDIGSGQKSRDRRPSRNRSPVQKSTHRSPDHSNRRDRSPSPAPRRRHDSKSSDSSASSETTSKNKRYAGYGLIHIKQRKDAAQRQPSQKSPSPPHRKPKEPLSTTKSAPKYDPKKTAWKPLSEEEMEKRRQEMMDNAKWRDQQRQRNVRRLERDEEEQSKKDTKQSGESVDFIQRMVAKSTDHDSVEGRVKSKVQRLQRSHGAMESHFARK